MPRFHQLLFIVSWLALCWLGMMGVHELGHVVGALITGGSVERVVLHPLSISRTDVAPNPHPAAVVWLGPVSGCLLPLAVWLAVPRRLSMPRNLAGFFAGFCLLANGAYIGLGAMDGVGDCGQMLRTGSPMWLLWTFGAIAMALGLWVWHGLGSPREFMAEPSLVDERWAYALANLLAVLATALFVFSPA